VNAWSTVAGAREMNEVRSSLGGRPPLEKKTASMENVEINVCIVRLRSLGFVRSGKHSIGIEVK